VKIYQSNSQKIQKYFLSSQTLKLRPGLALYLRLITKYLKLQTQASSLSLQAQNISTDLFITCSFVPRWRDVGEANKEIKVFIKRS
jgi:hypothetical protein